MKKVITYAIVLFVVTIITVSATFAYFSSTVTANNPLTGKTHQLEVIYTGDEEINGNLSLVKTKEEGHRREVSIALSANSIDAVANIYIHIEQITSTLATEALNWEIYKVENDEEVYYDSGTFLDCEDGDTTKKCTSGDRIYMIRNLELSTTSQKFVIYLWLNGYKAGNEVLGATFKGYIGAETENISGVLQ